MAEVAITENPRTGILAAIAKDVVVVDGGRVGIDPI